MTANIEFFPHKLISEATATGAGSAFHFKPIYATFQASGVTSAGTGTAVVDIEVSNDGSNWITMGTISLTLGTTETSDGFASQASWKNVRATIPTGGITGTDASVTVTMGG